MRKPSIVAFGFTITMALVGCTSLLGDFDVGSASGDGGPGNNGEGGACTAMCNGKCVDTATDSLNCGACAVVCPGGQTCQTSKCACPTGQAFCNGMCSTADRMHCGPTCTPCQADEICGMACSTAPAPTFKTFARDPSGWKDAAGAAFTIEVTAVAAPGVIYECRTGPAATFTPTVPPFAACDGKAGSGTVHTPTPNATTPEGTYRTEYRYRSDTYRSPTIFQQYYIHHSLDKALTCPRAGKDDGPHFTDDQYFAAAQAYSVANSGLFPVTAVFAAPSNPPSRLDPIYLAAPFIKIPFTGIAITNGMISGSGWPAAGGDYTLNERALRHKYVMNPTRTMILERRQYVNPKSLDCAEKFRFGSRRARDTYGPTVAMRGPHFVECEALVVNAHGAGLCLSPDSTGKKPVAIEIDHHPNFQVGNNGGTVTAAANGTVVTTSLGFGSIPAGTFIQIPGGGVGGVGGGKWYKVVSAATPSMNISEPYIGPPGAQTWRLSSSTLIPTTNIPTAFAKMHYDAHQYATGAVQPGTPEPKTKCEVVGCNTGKPWLTYLPP